MPNKPIINLGIAPDTGTGDSARRGGEKINNLLVDTYTLMGDNAFVLDNTDVAYGTRSTFTENSFMIGELHPAGRWQRVIARDPALPGTASLRNDGSNGNIFYASRGEQLNIDVSSLSDAAGTAPNLPGSAFVNNNRFQVILPLAREGDIVRIRDANGSWGDTDGAQASGIDVWTTPLNYQGVESEWDWDIRTPGASLGSKPSVRHTHINEANYSRSAVSASADNTAIVPASPFPITTKYADLEFVYTGHAGGWLVNPTTFNPGSAGNAALSFESDDSDWFATTTDGDPTYSLVFAAIAHTKATPIVQVGVANLDSGGDIISYSTNEIMITNVAVITHQLSTRDDSGGMIPTPPAVTVNPNDIIITVDAANGRFRGRIIASQGI